MAIITNESDFEYAGFWVRVGATLIDIFLQILITMPPLVAIYGESYLEKNSFSAGIWDFFINYVVLPIIVITFWIYYQATPGKMAVGAKIVDARTGGKPSNSQLIGRYFAYFVSILPLMLGIFWIAFDKRKQGWHDKLAGTVVIKLKNNGPEEVHFEYKKE